MKFSHVFVFTSILTVGIFVTWYFETISLNVNMNYVYVPPSANHDFGDTKDKSMNLGFSLFEVANSIQLEVENNRKNNITAILLHWKRSDNIQKLINIFQEKNLFDEIIVWNNNPEIIFRLDGQLINHTSSVRIINSKENIKDRAKYQACAQAKTQACFYVDDDWNPSHYINTLVASFRSDPTLLHSVTDDYTFYTNLVWTYFDSSIDLHTGFSWIGCGSIFLREHAQKHLELMDRFLVNRTVLIDFADVFFSIWLNQVPVQLHIHVNQLLSMATKRKLFSFSQTPDFAKHQHESSIKAIEILEHELRSKSTDEPTFPRKKQRRFPTYLKSPSRGDNLIFYTNIFPFDFENIPFNISIDKKRSTRENLPRGASVDNFCDHACSRAVDESSSTFWTHPNPAKIGQFFAIDLLKIETNVSLSLIVKHDQLFHQNLELSISLDGLWWIPYRSLNGIFIKKQSRFWSTNTYIYLIDSSRFNSGFSTFRYMKYQVKDQSQHIFRVCEFKRTEHDFEAEIASGNFIPLFEL